MKRLWIAFAVIASFGSLFPFDFHYSRIDTETIWKFLNTCCTSTGRGDILGNILLFLPFGFIGMFAVRRDSGPAPRLGIVLLSGIAFATLLQVLQIYLPSRDESLQDVIWNACGIFAGAVLAIVADGRIEAGGDRRLSAESVPLLLITSWLIYRLSPFVPSIDLQLWKDSLKPLLEPQLAVQRICHDLGAWLVIAYLLSQLRLGLRLDRHLPALIVTVFALEVVIIDNALYASNVIGAALAAIAWAALSGLRVRPEGPVLAILLFGIAVSGLTPFVPAETWSDFRWMPFSGFLGGSMYVNALSAAEKVFFYGSLVFLLHRAALSYAFSIAAAFCLVFFIEIAQMRLAGRTPEITDPLLVLLAAGALLLLEDRQVRLSGIRGSAVHRPVSSFGASRSRVAGQAQQRRHWISQSINIHAEQLDFLTALAHEMGVSVSCVTRRIVASLIEEAGLAVKPSARSGDRLELSWALGDLMEADSDPGNGGWARIKVNFRREQFELLAQTAAAAGISVSNLTRGLVTAFIAGLDRNPEVSARIDTP